MNKSIVIYQSTTGFTKKYAEWISKELNCDSKPIDNVNKSEIKKYSFVVFGGGLHAGRITGLKKYKKLISTVADSKSIVFITGATPKEAIDITALQKDNSLIDTTKLFYFQSGVNYERMNIANRAVMKVFSAALRSKKNQTAEEKGQAEMISQSCDHSKIEYIKPLVDYITKA